jgi:hypothetical protein
VIDVIHIGVNKVTSKIEILSALLIFAIFQGCTIKHARDCTIPLPINEEGLIGTWVRETPTRETVFSFRDDRTFSGYLKERGVIRWRFGGEWKINKNQLYWVYKFSDNPRVPLGTDVDTLIRLECDAIIGKSNISQRLWEYRRLNSTQQQSAVNADYQ